MHINTKFTNNSNETNKNMQSVSTQTAFSERAMKGEGGKSKC